MLPADGEKWLAEPCLGGFYGPGMAEAQITFVSIPWLRLSYRLISLRGSLENVT